MSYTIPSLPKLVLTSTFLALLPVTSHLSSLLTNTDLLGPLTLGILWCSPALPPPAPLLPQEYIPFLTFLGYVGLLLLIFDAGISTPTALLMDARNLAASAAVGLTGILVPIALSFALFQGSFGFSSLTAFAAGAALCSTSLGTTVSLLSGGMKKSRVGVVLMTAALLDDVVGLVIAGVIGNLVGPDGLNEQGEGRRIEWKTIVRPVLVSVAYALVTPALAILAKRYLKAPYFDSLGRFVGRTFGRFFGVKLAHLNLFVIIATLMTFVATSHVAGTSELFGAYLAGAFLGYVFDRQPEYGGVQDSPNPIYVTFNSHIAHTLLHPLLSPLFFASIGASIPVNQFFTIYIPGSGGLEGAGQVMMVKSHRVIWRGVVYSILMVFAKAVVGIWVFAFWTRNVDKQPCSTKPLPLHSSDPTGIVIEDGSHSVEPLATPSVTSSVQDGGSSRSRVSTALLLGMAMVARGEIALIVAQLARPLLVVPSGSDVGMDSEEPFVIVMWSILVTTFVGALGVGWVTRSTA